MAAEDPPELNVEITQEDIDEARRLAPSDDLAEIEVEVGEPLD